MALMILQLLTCVIMCNQRAVARIMYFIRGTNINYSMFLITRFNNTTRDFAASALC